MKLVLRADWRRRALGGRAERSGALSVDFHFGRPACVWQPPRQGGADVLVPPAMGRYQAETIPNCEARYFPGERHLLVIDHVGKILDEFTAEN
jgi:pimeloyl-ACP methyl ester carboxylesterase